MGSVCQRERPDPGPPNQGDEAAPSVRRPIWWRFLGLTTALIALMLAHTVWGVNRHVSRMELARIFAMVAMPRASQVPPAVVETRPARRPPRTQPEPAAKEVPPFSVDPTKWIHPPDPCEVQRSAAEPAPEGQPSGPPEPEVHPLRQTEVSEVTRQTWTLLSLVLLMCVGLAGVSAVLDMGRARRNLFIAAWFLIAGTALTVVAGKIITEGLDWPFLAEHHYLQAVACGGGFPPLAGRDYAQVILRGAGYAVILIFLLLLPRSRNYARALRRQVATGGPMLRPARPVTCGLLYVGLAGVCAAPALFGDYLSLPAWHLIRWVLIGWSVPAALLGLAVCTGRRGVLLAAYAFGVIGLVLQLACWGLPFAVIGPPSALRTLLVILPFCLILLGRLRDCMAMTKAWQATRGSS